MPTTTLDRPPLQQTLFAAMAAKIVYAAAELELPDLLADGPRASSDLAIRIDADEPSLGRLLRALAGLGIVEQTDAGDFELTELGEPLRSGVPGSMRELVTMLSGPELWRSWGELVPSVCRGETGWELAHGMTWVDFYEHEPDRSANFNAAMSEHTRDAAPGILAAADLSRFATVMDVGGGDGTLIAAALEAQPGLAGVLFDLPAGLVAATRTLDAAGVGDRCRLVPGDFFDSIPAEVDAFLLKQVLHDWEDERATTILRNVARAMSAGARLLIVERTLPERVGPADVPTLLLDILMLVVTGGRERTEREFEALLAAAGLELRSVSERLEPLDYRVLEAARFPLTRGDARS